MRSTDLMNRRVNVDRIVYATITLMSVLIIYDGWSSLKLLQLAGVVVGPVFAMFLGHSFSAAMARQVNEGRALTNSERIAILRSESPFLLLCVPPIVLGVTLHLLGVSLSATINIVVWIGVASLGFWGGVAARRARLVGWHFVSAVLAGLIVGGVILVLQVTLQPGSVL
jgi:hypothetical protein